VLDSVILKEVCENIFEDLTKLVEARNHVIPSNIYEEQWTSLRERVDYIMFEMKKLSQEAHNQTLHNLFKDVTRSMEEVELNRIQLRVYSTSQIHLPTWMPLQLLLPVFRVKIPIFPG